MAIENETLRAEIATLEKRNSDMYDAMKSCVDSENAKSAEILQMRVSAGAREMAWTAERDRLIAERDTLDKFIVKKQAEVAALKVKENAYDQTVDLLTEVSVQRDAAIAALMAIETAGAENSARALQYIAHDALEALAKPAGEKGDAK